MERLEYGRYFRDDGDDGGNHDESDAGQIHDRQEYHGETGETYEPRYDLDPGLPLWEDHPPERLRDAVGHQAEHRAEAQAEYFAARLGWRYRSRLRRQGRNWVPPNTSEYVAPVFVPVSYLLSPDGEPAADQAQHSLPRIHR